jgi:hypothetical protein
VVVSAYFLKQNSMTIALICFGIGISFLVITLVKAVLLAPLNKLWMRFGIILGMVVSPIVLGIIFYGLFAVIGVGMRLCGRDELRLNLKSRVSYWKLKETESSPLSTFENQF